jgi:catechol 2,3-dioxygenase-like lactoylglutathione lyase family enzyme
VDTLGHTLLTGPPSVLTEGLGQDNPDASSDAARARSKGEAGRPLRVVLLNGLREDALLAHALHCRRLAAYLLIARVQWAQRVRAKAQSWDARDERLDWPDPELTAHSATPNHLLLVRRQGDIMTVKRMDNVGIVVEDIDAAIEFFTELGLVREGRAPVEGDWADGVTGLRDMRVEIAMMRTPDGHSRLELSRFLAPPVVADHRSAPVNALGYLRVMFTVEDIDDTLARLGERGAKLVGDVVQYEDMYRLCYIRGPEGILIGLAQQLGQQTSRANPM